MPQKNGYIQIEVGNGEDSAVLHFYPPLPDGEPVTFRDADDYLSAEGYLNYDKKALADLLNSDSKESMPIGFSSGLECQERMVIKVSIDKMKATSGTADEYWSLCVL